MLNDLQRDYLDLLKMTLTDFHHVGRTEFLPVNVYSFRTRMLSLLDRWLRRRNYAVMRTTTATEENRLNGLDWPQAADSMIGLNRLNNIQHCIVKVVEENIEGDMIETGVWRGGATIFMRAVLKALGETQRTVWVADSFEGLPKPDTEKYTADRHDKHYMQQQLAIPLEEVKHNFRKYGLLDEQVKFLKGWFSDTLHKAPIKNLAVLRLDGDMYGSTMDALTALYPKLSAGGFCIVDDWNAVEGCKQAVNDYRTQHGISDEIMEIDPVAVYWRKTNSG